MKKITLLLCLFVASIASAQFTSLAITGDAVGGWPNDDPDPHTMTTTDGVTWTYEDLVVGVGSFKIRADNSWSNNWGAPGGQAGQLSGTAVSDSQTNFSPSPGVYDITFNTTTLAYSFVAQETGFSSINLAGAAVNGSAISMYTADGIIYTAMAVNLAANDAYFVDADDATNFWGFTQFPSGTASAGTNATEIPAGLYNVTFNLETLAYSFAFVQISLVGSSSPAGWPTGAAGEVDAQQMWTLDGVNYTINNITLTAYTDSNSGVKFRQNNSWNVNWGAGDFPTGTATQGGPNVQTVAGSFSVHFNRETGAYSFDAPMSVTDFRASAIKAYPNPTKGEWKIATAGESITKITVSDFSGKTVLTAVPGRADASVDASGLSAGIYFANVETASGSRTVKLVRQ